MHGLFMENPSVLIAIAFVLAPFCNVALAPFCEVHLVPFATQAESDSNSTAQCAMR